MVDTLMPERVLSFLATYIYLRHILILSAMSFGVHIYYLLFSVYFIYKTIIVRKCEIEIQKDIDIHKREVKRRRNCFLGSIQLVSKSVFYGYRLKMLVDN